MPIRSVIQSSTAKQQGVALLMSLVFLVMLTVLGFSVFTTTTSEEKMARNFRDKEIAMHAAEVALKEAILLITASYDSDSPPGTLPQALTIMNCSTGAIAGFSCDPTIDASTIDLYAPGAPGANVSGGAVASTLSPIFVGLAAQPRYLVVVRQNPHNCGHDNSSSCFTIIAQAKGLLTNTRVDLVEMFTN